MENQTWLSCHYKFISAEKWQLFSVNKYMYILNFNLNYNK